MAGQRRPQLQDREPGIDLFDDPPWDTGRDVQRTPFAWLGHVAFVLLLVVLGLLGVVGVIAVVSLVAFVRAFHFDAGPFDITLPLPSSYGMDIALSADGSVAYVTEPNNDSLLVLNATTGRVLATVTVGSEPSGLAVSPDGSQVWVVDTTQSPSSTQSSPGLGLGSGSGSVSVVATATDKVLGTIPVGTGPIDVAFSPDGRSAYVTNNGAISPGSVSVIDTATLEVVGTLTPAAYPSAGPAGSAAFPSAGSAGSNPTSVAVTPDGKEVWVSAVDDLAGSSTTPDTVSVFDTATGDQRATIPVGSGPFFMALSHDGRDAYVADKLSCDVREIDTSTLRVVATVDWPSSRGCPYGLATSRDDNVVYTVTGSDLTFNEGHAGNAFGSVDFATGQAHVAGDVGQDPVTVALSPDAATAYVVDAGRPVIDLVDPADGSIKATFTIPD